MTFHKIPSDGAAPQPVQLLQHLPGDPGSPGAAREREFQGYGTLHSEALYRQDELIIYAMRKWSYKIRLFALFTTV
jgi:hypothetical protein